MGKVSEWIDLLTGCEHCDANLQSRTSRMRSLKNASAVIRLMGLRLVLESSVKPVKIEG